MRFKFYKRNKKIKQAMKIAEKILALDEFYSKIESITSFDNSNISPAEIAEQIRSYRTVVIIRTIWNPRIGNAVASSSKFFKINTLRLGRKRTIPKVVNTIIHEYVHCVDFNNDTLEFTHFDNENTNGEEDNTAPWKIGEIAEEFAENLT
ncbi:hypothetical protein [uncultured Dokdonia sp.]|uniref:hypothetical protein n=1 Tax=uncultured Dokdonia sp. TaxID=575653 RepID=UPI00261FB99F|nr:hypothetical protein [uncultured Dokdonia sp.]